VTCGLNGLGAGACITSCVGKAKGASVGPSGITVSVAALLVVVPQTLITRQRYEPAWSGCASRTTSVFVAVPEYWPAMSDSVDQVLPINRCHW